VRLVLLASMLGIGLLHRAVSVSVILVVRRAVRVRVCTRCLCRRCAVLFSFLVVSFVCSCCIPLVAVPPPVLTDVSMDSLCLINLLFSSWNVRVLGDEDKCHRVRDNVVSSLPSVMCIQDSKLARLDAAKARSFLPSAVSDFVVVDANGAAEGLSSPGTGACSLYLPPLPGFLA
jgi:hypothetical protein